MQDFALPANVLEENQVPPEMITYGGAPHAFTVFGDDRYRKDADEKSWTRFIVFLKVMLTRGALKLHSVVAVNETKEG
jgi:dienelactone hydrolase